MSAKVWMSGLFRNYDVGMKQGIRAKFRGHDWNPASLTIPLAPDVIFDAHQRNLDGLPLEPNEFPEAGAVWNEKLFRKVKDVLMVGPFYVVRRDIAEVLAEADFGEGGLVPCKLYKQDLQTPQNEKYYFFNLGCIKDTLVIDQCDDAKTLAVNKDTGLKIYKLNRLNSAARVRTR